MLADGRRDFLVLGHWEASYSGLMGGGDGCRVFACARVSEEPGRSGQMLREPLQDNGDGRHGQADGGQQTPGRDRCSRAYAFVEISTGLEGPPTMGLESTGQEESELDEARVRWVMSVLWATSQ